MSYVVDVKSFSSGVSCEHGQDKDDWRRRVNALTMIYVENVHWNTHCVCVRACV